MVWRSERAHGDFPPGLKYDTPLCIVLFIRTYLSVVTEDASENGKIVSAACKNTGVLPESPLGTNKKDFIVGGLK